MYMNAKTYAESTGLPVETIRRFCRTGVLPNIRCGRVYMVDTEAATGVIREMAGAVKPKYTSFGAGIEELRKKVKRYAEA